MLLTPSTLDRCANPNDWLRREIETALDEKRNIVPLFLDGFEFGKSSTELAGKLALLKNYNGLNVPTDYFEEAMQRLKNRFLNIPLDAVLHPISISLQRVVQDQQIALTLKAQAEDFMKGREFQSALQIYKKIQELNPKFPDIESTIKDIERIIKILDLVKEAEDAEKSKDWNLALRAYEKVKELEPNHPDIISKINELYRKIEVRNLVKQVEDAERGNNWDTALAACQKIKGLDPNYPDITPRINELTRKIKIHDLVKEAKDAEVKSVCCQNIWDKNSNLLRDTFEIIHSLAPAN